MVSQPKLPLTGVAVQDGVTTTVSDVALSSPCRCCCSFILQQRGTSSGRNQFFLGESSSDTLPPHRRRGSFTFFFAQNTSFVPPLRLSLPTEGIFRGSFSPRAQNTIPEVATTWNYWVGAQREFSIFRHESGPEF